MVVDENEDEETTRMRKRWRNGVAEHGDEGERRRRRRMIMRMMNNMMTRSMRIDEGCSG